jgi:hypothetical protein
MPFGMPPLPKPGILDSPGVQGLLSAYLGAIGSPRSKGMGGALSAGGLAGLSAYQQAKSAQFQPYLMGAQLAHLQSQMGAEKASTAHTMAETQQMAGEAEANKQFATQLHQMADQETDPKQKQKLLTIANGVAVAPKWVNPNDVMKDLDAAEKDAVEMQTANLHNQQQQWELTTLDPLKAQHEAAGISAEGASTMHSEVATEGERLKQQLVPDERAATITTTDEKLDKQYDAAHPYARLTMPGYNDAKEAWKTQQKVKLGVMRPKAASTPGAPPPKPGDGITPGMQAQAKSQGLTIGPDGLAYDAQGTPHRFDPNA